MSAGELSFTLDDALRDTLLAPGRASSASIQYLNGSSRPAAPVSCVVAIGVFDGCHRGHQTLLAEARADAHERGVACVAVTFDPDPDVVLSAHPARKLMTTSDRLAALVMQADQVVVVPFTRELAACDHVAFFEDVLADHLDIRAVHVGADFKLGARGASTVSVMRAWGAPRGIEVVGHDLLLDGVRPICATRIRAHIAAGDMGSAAFELGRHYMVRGRVGHGRGQGTGMGFPTANIEVGPTIQLPADGVYAGYALVGTSVWPAAINVGVPPMFAGDAASARLEANLLGCSGDLYGAELAIVFDRRLRASEHFANIDELVVAVRGDIEAVREQFGSGLLGVLP